MLSNCAIEAPKIPTRSSPNTSINLSTNLRQLRLIELASKMIQTVLEWLFKVIGLKQSVRVLCHRAFLIPNGPECYFINVTNLSFQRDAEITHVWMESGNEIPVLNPSRSLPRRLKPEETWETWIEVESLPTLVRADAFKLARVRLSNGRIIKSKKNENVPSVGYVPGG